MATVQQLHDRPDRTVHSVDLDWFDLPKQRRDAILEWVVRWTSEREVKTVSLGEGFVDLERYVTGDDGRLIMRDSGWVTEVVRVPVGEPPPPEWWPTGQETT